MKGKYARGGNAQLTREDCDKKGETIHDLPEMRVVGKGILADSRVGVEGDVTSESLSESVTNQCIVGYVRWWVSILALLVQDTV